MLRRREAIPGAAMIWFRPPLKQAVRKKWWDTKLSRRFGAEGWAAKLWVDHFFPRDAPEPENDRDRLRW